MKQYIDNLKRILKEGTTQGNRTAVEAITIPGTHMEFDLNDGFPLITTKKMATKAIVGELIGFMRGYDNAKDFRELGCGIWTANANETPEWLASPYRKGEDDLGRIYGVQWRKRRDIKFASNGAEYEYLMKAGYLKHSGYVYSREFDQLDWCIDEIRNNPGSRRIIIDAWKPDEFAEMALPPCHVSYHWLVNQKTKTLNLCMHQRSADYFLGVPFNIASASLLLSIMARATNLQPGKFNHFLDDSHVYSNALDQVKTQIKRKPLKLCYLAIDSDNWDLSSTDALCDSIQPGDFAFNRYASHDPIKAEMVV